MLAVAVLVRIITSVFLLCGASKCFSTVVVLMSLGFLSLVLVLLFSVHFISFLRELRCALFGCFGFACI